MTTEIFLMLLVVGSILTGWVTEAVKSFLNSIKMEYVTNILVLVISIIVGGGTMIIYYTLNSPSIDNRFMYTLIMIVLNWLGSMIGYDKIIQTIKQFKSTNPTEEIDDKE